MTSFTTLYYCFYKSTFFRLTSKFIFTGDLDKPYLRTAAQLTVSMLGKFLRHKLKIDASRQVEIVCKNTVLMENDTLLKIHGRFWSDKPSNDHLILNFRLQTLN